MTRPCIASKADDPWSRIWFDTAPRHLAGPGDPRHVTQALRAAGWKSFGDPDLPHVVLASPDYRHTLVLEPTPETYGSWWRISSNHWHAFFGGNTPAEIIAGFTDALLHPRPRSSRTSGRRCKQPTGTTSATKEATSTRATRTASPPWSGGRR